MAAARTETTWSERLDVARAGRGKLTNATSVVLLCQKVCQARLESGLGRVTPQERENHVPHRFSVVVSSARRKPEPGTDDAEDDDSHMSLVYFRMRLWKTCKLIWGCGFGGLGLRG